MKTIACIPVHGRLPLLKVTIERLLRQNIIVLCAGDPAPDFNFGYGESWFRTYENKPLGKKWNALFQWAKEFDPDNILFVGSSDWVSDNWMSTINPLMDEYDMVGQSGFYLLDIAEQMRVCHWKGYGPGPRQDEPIGIGRVISARILDKINWTPFDDTKNNSMDRTMFDRVKAAGGKIKLLNDAPIKSLSISCDKWENMHKFEQHWSNQLPSTKIMDHSFLPAHFPDAFKIF